MKNEHLQVVDFSNPNADKIISTSTKYMKTKQTSIDWLIEQLTPSITLQQKYIDNIKKQAKEMEKEQMINAYANGHNDGCRYMNNEKQQFEHAEDYYNETYGGNK